MNPALRNRILAAGACLACIAYGFFSVVWGAQASLQAINVDLLAGWAGSLYFCAVLVSGRFMIWRRPGG